MILYLRFFPEPPQDEYNTMTTINITKRDRYGDVLLKTMSMDNIPRIGETISMETKKKYVTEQVLKVEKVIYSMPHEGGYTVEVICGE